MKTIDADKFIERLNQIRADIKPDQSSIDNNHLMSIYWNAIDTTMAAIIRSAKDSTQETPD